MGFQLAQGLTASFAGEVPVARQLTPWLEPDLVDDPFGDHHAEEERGSPAAIMRTATRAWSSVLLYIFAAIQDSTAMKIRPFVPCEHQDRDRSRLNRHCGCYSS